jgi:dTDP-glucose 4,6-dehydratase
MADLELKGKSVLVTGGAGFIGSSLVRQLQALGCHVLVLDNLLAGKREHLEGTNAELIVGDIRNSELLNYILSKNQVDFCFHLAANPFIPHGYENPEFMFSENTLGTIRVLKACHKGGVKRIVFYSTSEVYGTARTELMDESHLTTPHSTYAIAKLAADRECFVLHKEKKIPVVILRQFNCFGPREAQPYIIPEIISQFAHKGTTLSLGNLKARRDFTFVDDATKGVTKLAQVEGIDGEVVNFGRGENYSVQEIAEAVADIMKIDNWGVAVDQARLRPYDVERLKCNNSKFNNLTGGIEFTPFKEGLEQTVQWYLDHNCKWSFERGDLPVRMEVKWVREKKYCFVCGKSEDEVRLEPIRSTMGTQFNVCHDCQSNPNNAELIWTVTKARAENKTTPQEWNK